MKFTRGQLESHRFLLRGRLHGADAQYWELKRALERATDLRDKLIREIVCDHGGPDTEVHLQHWRCPKCGLNMEEITDLAAGT